MHFADMALLQRSIRMRFILRSKAFHGQGFVTTAVDGIPVMASLKRNTKYSETGETGNIDFSRTIPEIGLFIVINHLMSSF